MSRDYVNSIYQPESPDPVHQGLILILPDSNRLNNVAARQLTMVPEKAMTLAAHDRILKYDEATYRVEPSADRCCDISIDEVGVKFQKGHRKGKYENLQYTINSTGMRDAFKLLVAFLLGNGLMENHRLVFFTDDAVCIREYIEKFLGFRRFTVIPDRLHLKKKCNELLSMAIK